MAFDVTLALGEMLLIDLSHIEIGGEIMIHANIVLTNKYYVQTTGICISWVHMLAFVFFPVIIGILVIATE